MSKEKVKLNDNYCKGAKYFQCKYCKKVFSPLEINYSRVNILKEYPYCHGEYKVMAIYAEKGARHESNNEQ